MAKQANQKLKLLRLKQILEERTDEDHPLTASELIEALAQYDIHAERKSIYDDLEALCSFGLDVQCRKGKGGGWFLGSRDFELAELKLLVDAVQASRFITKRKSDDLIRKLEKLSSTHDGKSLRRQVYVDKRVKTMNESIYYNVDKLHEAISVGKIVTFLYFEHNTKKERVYRRNGQLYRVSPYGLIWDNENYYLVGWDSETEDVRHYRVDKMLNLTVTKLPRRALAQFDMAAYSQKHFGMFSGSERTVTLRFENRLVGVVLDRFGQDVILVPDGSDHFTVTLQVVVSPQFWGWLFGLVDGASVAGPQSAVTEYRALLKSALSRCGDA